MRLLVEDDKELLSVTYQSHTKTRLSLSVFSFYRRVAEIYNVDLYMLFVYSTSVFTFISQSDQYLIEMKVHFYLSFWIIIDRSLNIFPRKISNLISCFSSQDLLRKWVSI